MRLRVFSSSLLLLAGALWGAENRPDARGFIADWLISGPYPSYVVDSRDTGLEFDPWNGEAAIRPWPGKPESAVFKIDEAKMIVALDIVNEWGVREERRLDATWKAFRFPNPEAIMMDRKFLPIDDHFAFYAGCYLESPTEQEVQFRLGVDDEHKLYLNGALLGQAATSQAVRPDTFIYRARLDRGLNFLLLKVVDRTFDCGFCLAVTALDGAPCAGIRVHTESPARQLGVDAYENRFGLALDFGGKTLYDDTPHELRLRFSAPDARPYRLELGGQTLSVSNGESRRLEPALASGPNKLRFRVKDETGTVVAEPVYEVTVYDRRELSAQQEKLRSQLRDLDRKTAAVEREISAVSERVAQEEKQLEAARAEAEDGYARRRQAAQAKANASVDLPFEPGPPLRTRLLLNGPWSAGLSPERLDRQVRLPLEMVGPYHRSRFYPVVSADPKNPFAEAWKPLPGYEKHPFDGIVNARRAWFGQEFTARPDQGAYFFLCENVIGQIKVFCNGELSGEYRGKVGLVEIPLRKVIEGRNRLRLEFIYDGVLKNDDSPNYGILGDLVLEQRNPVHVRDVWIKPSWRQSTLTLTSTLANPRTQPQPYRLKSFIVLDGRIKFILPESTGELKAGETTEVTVASGWRDPECWSPTQPRLYTLISELSCGGRVVDRRSEPFGFREFWMHGVDFFFNGKRIILQGDVGIDTFGYAKCRDVLFPLLRSDGVNLLRLHDAKGATLPAIAAAADAAGMFLEVQFYPDIDPGRTLKNPLLKEYPSLEAYRQSDQHRRNLAEYTRWFRTFRNHPSVVLWSVDNELMTPGSESRGLERRNELVDGIADLYKRHMQQLDPSLVVTRDGDVCTYHSRYSNFDPSIPGNVHYPEFHPETFEDNWQAFFEYRPVIYGETLYCSYVWGGGRGARPEIVADKARQVREKAGKYRKIGIPAAIYMGVGLDGFVELKADGSGSPWKVAEVPRGETPPVGWRHGVPDDEYPFLSVVYPADSGPGLHPPYSYNQINWFGFRAVNWCSSKYPTFVRNAVNDAYRDTLIPQPPLPVVQSAEAVLILTPGAEAFTTTADGNRYGVRADAAGRAWFVLDRPGVYPVTVEGKTREIEFKARHAYATKPGFDQVPVLAWKVE